MKIRRNNKMEEVNKKIRAFNSSLSVFILAKDTTKKKKKENRIKVNSRVVSQSISSSSNQKITRIWKAKILHHLRKKNKE
jgi:hypothetical protein